MASSNASISDMAIQRTALQQLEQQVAEVIRGRDVIEVWIQWEELVLYLPPVYTELLPLNIERAFYRLNKVHPCTHTLLSNR